MELINKTKEKIRFIADMEVSLANAIRRSVGEIPILAIYEADIYKNDSALYDGIITHRLGLIPLKNQKLKEGQTVEMKLRVKSKDGKMEVLSGDLEGDVVYQDMPLVLLEGGQELKLVARANIGKGINHSRHSPGILFYKHYPKIQISSEGEKQSELGELFPEVFEVESSGKLAIKDAAACDFDEEDFKDYPGIKIVFDDKLVFTVESWGQIEAEDIFTESCEALKANLSEVLKIVK